MALPRDPRRELGRRGEEAAASWYTARGYVVLARNWRCPAGEIDLICARVDGIGRRTRRTLIVCEVKTRRSVSLGHPLEAVTPTKQRRLRRVTAAFLRGQGERYEHVRFDVAAVTARRIDVVESAF